MINKRILNMIGYVLLFLGISMVFSVIWSFIDDSNDLNAILLSMLITSGSGLILILLTQVRLIKFFPYLRLNSKLF